MSTAESPRDGPRSRRDPAPAGRGDRAVPSARAAGAHPAEPFPASPPLRLRVDRVAGRVASQRRPHPAAHRSPASRWALRDHRGRAPLARGARSRARDSAGRHSRRGRGAPHGDGADRERRPRAAQPGGRGACLRDARRGPRSDQGGAGPPPRPQPRRTVQPDPDPRPARRGARASGSRRTDPRGTAARS